MRWRAAGKLVEAAVDVGWQAEAAAAGDDAGQLVRSRTEMLGCKPSMPSTCCTEMAAAWPAVRRGLQRRSPRLMSALAGPNDAVVPAAPWLIGGMC